LTARRGGKFRRADPDEERTVTFYATVLTPPTDLPVTVADVQLRVPEAANAESELIEAYIMVVTAHLDGPEGRLRRCLMRQTLKLSGDGFPSGRIDLPYGPVTEVQEVSYVDRSGASASVSGFRLVRTGTVYAHLVPAYGAHWPAARCDADAVSVVYTSGAETAGDVPAPIRHAIVLMTAGLLSMSRQDARLRRESVEGVGTQEWDVSGAIDAAMSGAAEALLQPFRVFA
jgi:uncharacterized phiE125 gp8 family phage protein